jgi:hypothetical protein
MVAVCIVTYHNLQCCIRQEVGDTFGVHQKIPKAAWPLPPHDAVEDFNKEAPTPLDPKTEAPMIDWHCSGRTRWTKETADLFANHFEENRQRGKFPHGLGEPSRKEVTAAFLNHVVYLKGLYHQEMLPVDDGANKRGRDKKSRSASRRNQVSLMLIFG